MTLPTRLTAAIVAIMGGQLMAQTLAPLEGIRATVRPSAHQTQLGKPVYAVFTIENTTDESITLTVPGAKPDIPSPEAGLPLSHIFSGAEGSGLELSSESGRGKTTPLGFRRSGTAPILMIGAHAVVGMAVDLRDYFPALRGAGRYRLTWSPYGGAVESSSVVFAVAPLKEAIIVTDFGSMTMRFYYQDAPIHVANFLELAADRFYDGKTFHRLEPGYLIQGGCPRGDGTGIRLDGKRLAGEFNQHVHQKGSVSMALLDDDPDSASCQFFICNTRQKDWDGHYTVFGQLVGEESFDVLDKLMSQPVDGFGRPQQSIYIRTIRVADAPQDAYPE